MIAALMLLPALWALGFGSPLEAKKFFLDALVIIFLSGAFIFSGREVSSHKVRKAELFLTSGLAFFILPMFVALPLIGTGHQIGIWEAYFEAVSGLTTTGASIYTHPKYETEATLLWRALTGWMGGLLTLTVCVSLFVPANIPGVGVKSITLIRQNENDSLPQRFRRSLKLVYRPYFGLTVIGFLALWLTGTGFFDSLCFALNTISTTGFVSQLDPVNTYLPPLSIFILCLLMLAGTLSFTLQIELFRGRLKQIYDDIEFSHLMIFILIITVLFILFSNVSQTETLSDAFTMAISLVSTTALPMAKSSNPTHGPTILIIFLPVVVGGMLLSTSGGLKIMRAVILCKHIWAEMKNLPYPSAVEHLKYEARRVDVREVEKIWFFAILTFVSFAIVVVLAGFFYPDFNAALLGSIALMSNAGGIAIISGQPDLFAKLSSFGHIFSSVIMVFGRLELMALLVLFNPTFWRSGN